MLLAGTLCTVAASLSACSGQPAVGPLGNGGTAGQQCISGPKDQPLTVGLYSLRNTGTAPATIDSVRLPSATLGLTMTRSWLTPIYHDTLLGVGWAYPLTPPKTTVHEWSGEKGALLEWARRRPAVGAVIRPGQWLTLVFGLTRTRDHAGRSGGPVIVYTVSGNTYTIHEAVTLLILPRC
jgi:hypothetical protein